MVYYPCHEESDYYSCWSTPFADLVGGLDGIGKEMGLQIKCQKSEIFEKMHRI